MQIAVPRRDRSGRREPGVVYVDIRTFGDEARICATRLRTGSLIGLSGRLEADTYREPEGGRYTWRGVLADQLELI